VPIVAIQEREPADRAREIAGLAARLTSRVEALLTAAD
jgi:hypothetical protein